MKPAPGLRSLDCGPLLLDNVYGAAGLLSSGLLIIFAKDCY